MAGVKPFFLTGANAKIKVNNRTLAFCTNVSYSVEVKHATPQVLGMYEASSVEPLSYLVTGSFTVIRYAADISSDINGQAPNGVAETGNGIGTWGADTTSQRLADGFDIKKGPDGRAYENLNPSKLHKATGFNIEVSQKFDGGVRSVSNIRDARITRADFGLSKKAAATQTFNFSAIYVDEDSFLADFSGSGQHFA